MEAKSPKKKTTRAKSDKPKTTATKASVKAKTASNSAYAAMRQRDGPRAIGSKTIPTPVPGSLSGMTFIITGILDSIERADAVKLIESCGGKVMSGLGKTCQYVIYGRDAGEKKMEKAREMQKIMLDENMFLLFVARQAQLFLKNVNYVLTKSNETVVTKQTDAKKKAKSPATGSRVARKTSTKTK